MDATEQPAANDGPVAGILRGAAGLCAAAAVAFARCFLTEPVVAQMAVIVAYLDAHNS